MRMTGRPGTVCRFGHHAAPSREQNPEEAAQLDAERYADNGPGRNIDGGGLPSERLPEADAW
jgi:hypothetical protein